MSSSSSRSIMVDEVACKSPSQLPLLFRLAYLFSVSNFSIPPHPSHLIPSHLIHFPSHLLTQTQRHPHLLLPPVPIPNPVRHGTTPADPPRVPRVTHLQDMGQAHWPSRHGHVRGEPVHAGTVWGLCALVGDLEGSAELSCASEHYGTGGE